MRTKGEAARVAVSAIGSYREQAYELEREHQALTEDRDRLVSELGQVRQELSAALLQSAESSALERVAAETGATFLVEQRRKLESYRATCANRLQTIEADADFQDRLALLDPVSSWLVRDLEEIRSRHASLLEKLGRFDRNENFQWLRGRQKERKGGAFELFWRAVTFAETREQMARKHCLSELGYSHWDELHGDYERTQKDCDDIYPRRVALEQRFTRLNELSREYESCAPWVHGFEERLTQELRSQLAKYFEDADISQLYRTIRPGLQSLAARLHGLRHKELYLRQMMGSLEIDIDDRQKRGRKVEEARVLWERKPWDRLSGNKEQWLVALPALKRESTTKKVRWIRSTRRNIVVYQDWDDYSLYWSHNSDFLPYDAFAWGCDDPMPYEGFTRQLFPDLDEYRRLHNQSKADYSEYKRLDREERRRAARAEREDYCNDDLGGPDGDDSDFGDSGPERRDESVDGTDIAIAATAATVAVVAVAATVGAAEASEAEEAAQLLDAS